MEKIKKVIDLKVALSILIPLIISLFSYVAAEAKYTEKLGQAEKNIVSLQTAGKEADSKLQSHILDNRKENDKLLIQIKVMETKLDAIHDDVKDLKKHAR